MITKGQIMIKKYILLIFLILLTGNLSAETKNYKMVEEKPFSSQKLKFKDSNS